MAEARKCDRCGGLYEIQYNPPPQGGIKKPKYEVTENYYSKNQHGDDESKRLDLCPLCVEKLKQFIGGKD